MRMTYINVKISVRDGKAFCIAIDVADGAGKVLKLEGNLLRCLGAESGGEESREKGNSLQYRRYLHVEEYRVICC